MSSYSNPTRFRRIQQGLCILCAQPHSTSLQHCPNCNRELKRKGKKLYHWRREQGICTCCGKEDSVKDKHLCLACSERYSKYYYRAKAKKANRSNTMDTTTTTTAATPSRKLPPVPEQPIKPSVADIPAPPSPPLKWAPDERALWDGANGRRLSAADAIVAAQNALAASHAKAKEALLLAVYAGLRNSKPTQDPVSTDAYRNYGLILKGTDAYRKAMESNLSHYAGFPVIPRR